MFSFTHHHSKSASRHRGFTQHLVGKRPAFVRRAFGFFLSPVQMPCAQGAGFTLLFAVLIGSLLFSLGVAIANIAVKEVALSSAGKNSETAFFSADTGIECALYWDLRVGKNTPVFPNARGAPKDADDRIQCGGNDLPLSYTYPALGLPQTAATTTFYMSLSQNGCVAIEVGKTTAQGPSPARTVIEARGRNDSDCTDTTANPLRIERALRVRY